METTEYIKKLIKEYIKATECKIENINIKEFSEWIAHRRIQTDAYAYLLNHMNLNFDTPLCVEIGKGRYDSVALSHDSTSIITPYVDKYMEINEDRIVIKSDFKVINNIPTLIGYNDKDKKETKQSEFKIYMTQNPYNKEKIINWEKLHNTGDTAIIFGIYGNIYDKDKNEKLKLLKELKSQMQDYYVETSETIKDQYYHVIATNIPAKTRKKQKNDKNIYFFNTYL